MSRIAGNSLWQISAWAVRMSVAMLVNIGMVRHLGPQDFGHFSYVHAFVLFVAALTPLGLQELTVHELLRDERRKAPVIFNVAVMRLAAALLAFALTIIWAFYRAPGPIEKIGLILLSVYFFPYAAEVSELWFQAKQDLRRTSQIRIVASCAGGLLAGWGIWQEYSVIWFYKVVLSEVLILGGGLSILLFRDLRTHRRNSVPSFVLSLLRKYHRNPGNNTGADTSQNKESTANVAGKTTEKGYTKPEVVQEPAGISANIMRNLLKKSWPLWLAGVALVGFSRLDQLMLGELSGNRELGFYAAAVRLSLVWSAVAYLLLNAVFPAVSSAFHQRQKLKGEGGAGELFKPGDAQKNVFKSGDTQQNLFKSGDTQEEIIQRSAIPKSSGGFFAMLQSMFDLLGLLAWVLIVPVTLLSPWIIRILYGAQWEASAQVLAIHIWINLFVFTRTGFDRWLVLYGKTGWSFVHHGATLVLNVALNLYFIPRWGAIGAAWASLAAIAVASGLLPLISPQVRAGALQMVRSWLIPLRIFSGSVRAGMRQLLQS